MKKNTFGQQVTAQIEKEINQPKASSALKIWFDLLNQMTNKKYEKRR